MDFGITSTNMPVMTIIDWSTGIAQFQVLVPSVACMGYAVSYCMEKKSDFIIQKLLRVSVTKYGISKIISVYLSAMAGSLLGYAVFVLILFVCGNNLQYDNTVLGIELTLGQNESLAAGLYIACYIYYRVIACGAYALLGLAISGVFIDVYATKVFPFIIIYLSKFITLNTFKMNKSIYSVEFGSLYWHNPLGELIFTTSLFVGMAVLFGGVFLAMITRREAHA